MRIRHLANEVWNKFKRLPVYAKVLISVSVCVFSIVAIASIFVIVLLGFFYGNDPKLSRNNAAVALEAGRVVIYQAELGAGDFDRLPRATRRFAIDDKSANARTWWIEPKARNGKSECSKLELQRSVAKIVYGDVPKCFKESNASDGAGAAPLKTGIKYELLTGDKPGDDFSETVYFILSRCAYGKPGCLFLKTNNPATPEIRRNMAKLMRE